MLKCHLASFKTKHGTSPFRMGSMFASQAKACGYMTNEIQRYSHTLQGATLEL